ncbi:MAG TPA: hypothetical protein VF601_16250 [Beijerinckiaceae bacterium]|jgi:hypothetical protein
MLVLRIAILIGLIVWFSPLRPSWNADQVAEVRAAAAQAAAARGLPFPPDAAQMDRMMEAWERMSPEARASAIDLRRPDLGQFFRESSAGAPKPAPARKPGG